METEAIEKKKSLDVKQSEIIVKKVSFYKFLLFFELLYN
jgi:hypothetical protein